MGTASRTLVLASAVCASFALAGTALARTPQLVVTGPPTTATSGEAILQIKEEKADAAPRLVSIYVPTGYLVNLSYPAGTQIGALDARLQALELSPEMVLDAPGGTIVAADEQSPELAADAERCTGKAAHDAIWLLHATVNARALDTPVFVDATTGFEAAFSAAKLVFCLGNPYQQAGPARAPLGAKLLDLKLTLAAGAMTNPPLAGTYAWRSAITPWTRDAATSNDAGTVEAQSLVTLAKSVSLRAKVTAKRTRKTVRGATRTIVTSSVVLSGRVLENLRGVADAKVTIFAGGKTVGSVRTSSTGFFTKRFVLRDKASFRVRVSVAARETSCTNPLPATAIPGGCASATSPAYELTSAAVIARPKGR